jgi:5-methyltetrahydrofolate--homocysteine methyltransferase
MDHDPNGMAWIGFSRVVEAMAGGATFAEASAAAQAAGGRSGRGGEGRRRRG